MSASTIELTDLPELVIRKLPRYLALPACLLGRLAVDREYQGQRLGRYLLLDALKRAVELSNHIGIVAVVVDALDESTIAFYRRYGFQALERESSRRLFIRLDDVKTLFPGST